MRDFINEIKNKIKNKIYENFEKYWNTIERSIKYVTCIIFIIIIFRWLIRYPLKLAVKYNIELSGQEYVDLYRSYGPILLGILCISVIAIPIVKLVNKLKNVSKEGAEFYEDNQYVGNGPKKIEIQDGDIKDIINSNDEKIFEEKSEENIYNKRISNCGNSINFLKSKNIKSNMKPLTVIVTMELYNNNKNNITKDIVFEYINNMKNRRKKKLEEQNKKIAKNIIEFLKNNDIIESDDIENGKYYFTPFGTTFMNYFQNGII